ncbi:hypothetical protein SDC9_202054 [bioreactor metagenome]|uniref:Uncharacterized protein n=1 Tax=bioreactor metagenome TaxID=1076179 RepID=A0A645J1K3_9ZZZZ
MRIDALTTTDRIVMATLGGNDEGTGYGEKDLVPLDGYRARCRSDPWGRADALGNQTVLSDRCVRSPAEEPDQRSRQCGHP